MDTPSPYHDIEEQLDALTADLAALQDEVTQEQLALEHALSELDQEIALFDQDEATFSELLGQELDQAAKDLLSD